MSSKPLGITDRRKLHRKHKHVESSEGSGSGAAKPLAQLFHDRRKNLGTGKRAS